MNIIKSNVIAASYLKEQNEKNKGCYCKFLFTSLWILLSKKKKFYFAKKWRGTCPPGPPGVIGPVKEYFDEIVLKAQHNTK